MKKKKLKRKIKNLKKELALSYDKVGGLIRRIEEMKTNISLSGQQADITDRHTSFLEKIIKEIKQKILKNNKK